MKAYKLNLTVRIALTDEQAEQLKDFNIFAYPLQEQLAFLKKYKANISQDHEMICEGKLVSLAEKLGTQGGFMGEEVFNQKYGN